MSMSQLYRDHSLLPDDHEWQEEPLVTIHLFLLSPSIPQISTDDEAEEVDGQEETHVGDTSSTATKTQEMLDLLAQAVAAVDLFLKQILPPLPMVTPNSPPLTLQQSAAKIFLSKQYWSHNTKTSSEVKSSLARAARTDACKKNPSSHCVRMMPSSKKCVRHHVELERHG